MYIREQDELRKEEAGQKTVFEWDDDLPGYVPLSVHACVPFLVHSAL
jgi:hypothetical protein